MHPPNPDATHRVGDYLIRGVLGEGGMGRVYAAEELLSHRRVALKILHPELTQSAEGRRQFVNEMAILSSLDDPHIVRCLHCTEIDGQLVMVLEHLDGQTLRAVLKQRGSLTWGEVVQVATHVALALRAAHSRTPMVIHRDLKPENVMWLSDGRAKVMDFGVAKILSTVGATTNQSFGTMQYMSPEQIDALPLGPTSDLYALGLVMWELLAGRPPFVADSPRVLLEMLCNTPVPPLPDGLRGLVPGELERLIGWLLEKDPRRRPQMADAVLEVLHRLQAPAALGVIATATVQPAATRTVPVQQVPAWSVPRAPELNTVAIVEGANGSGRGATVIAATVAVGVVLGIAVGIGVWAFEGEPEPRKPVAEQAIASTVGPAADEAVKAPATESMKSLPTKGPFPSLARYCETVVGDFEDQDCGLRKGPGIASVDVRGLGTVSVVGEDHEGFGGDLGLAFVSGSQVYVVEGIESDASGNEVMDTLLQTTISDQGGVAVVTFTSDHYERVYVDESRPGMEQGGASWTRIATVRCRSGSDGRPTCTEPVARYEARGKPTTPETEVWRAFVLETINQMQVPAWAQLALPRAQVEFNLKICKDGGIQAVILTKKSGNADLDGAIAAELERLKVPKPPPEVAITMPANCALFESFDWSAPSLE